MVKERRTVSIIPAVWLAALLGVVGFSLARFDDLVIEYLYFSFVLGVPVVAGALLGAIWRLVRRMLDRRSTHP
jgi:hypothetical protein